jgi:hypothetical protein
VPENVPLHRDIKIAEPTSAGDVLSWPVSSNVSFAEANHKFINIEHSAAGTWPTSKLEGSVDVEGNMWTICRVAGQWVAGTIDWLRPGQTKKDVPPSEYGPRWKAGYDSYRGPEPGELVGYFMSTFARFSERSSNQRSNIVWVEFGTDRIIAREQKGPDVPMAIFDTLKRVRAKYGASPTTDECGAICMETAWLHRNDPEKWGVSGKSSGNRANVKGVSIASDIIQNGVTKEGYDVLVAAGDGGPATPSWNLVGVITDPARPWLAPIDIGGTGPVDPVDPVKPVDLKPVLDRLDALAARQDALSAKLDGVFEALSGIEAALGAIGPLVEAIAALSPKVEKLITQGYRGEVKLLGMKGVVHLKPEA